MSAHTRGPWMARDKDSAIAITHEGPFIIAVVYGGLDDDGTVGPTSRANARLIAAAPDMRELLARVAEYFDGSRGQLACDVRALLDRIDGEQS